MIASDLAGELDIAPSVMSRRLKTYYTLTGVEKTTYLAEQTIADMRQAHDLLLARKARRTDQAIRIAIGLEQVTDVSEFGPRIEAKIDLILEKVAYIEAQVLETSRVRQAKMTLDRKGIKGDE